MPGAWAGRWPGQPTKDPRFPTLAHFREQAELLAEEGADLIALEMINARGYGRAALQAAAETGDWQPPNWVFGGLTPAGYLQQAITWAEAGVRLIGGCCGVGPEHIRALADGLPRPSTPPRPGP